jgi:alkyldihydroxyacetonephosphate synthase
VGRLWWGWGVEEEALDDEAVGRLGRAVAERLGAGDLAVRSAPPVDELALPAPRVIPPDSLAALCSTTPLDRAAHTHGKAFRDVARNLAGDLRHPPDLVASPTTEAEVAALLDWAGSEGVAVVPYGGGSSVVGGIECDVGDGFAGALSLDLTGLTGVVEVDRMSRAARVRAGTLGPDLEDALRPSGLTLRHFPQSFEFSTVGGWLATRSGGHYATRFTHVDDFVESIRAVTPSGSLESRRLPGSGAGPSPDRLLLGSEGTLGVITEAWLRLQDRPRFRASATARFATVAAGAEAARAVVQAGLWPANCRLLDPGEAATAAGVTDGSAVLLLGFESADAPVDGLAARSVELCGDHGGAVPDGIRTSSSEGVAGTWRGSFLKAPYLRDALARLGCISETFETAVTWDRFPELHASVTEAVSAALGSICGGGTVTCRFTHVYPDGCAPYFTVLAPGRPDALVSQWDEVKVAASEALLAAGGTITHHHAVGRDHQRWYDRQRPDLFGVALAAAKHALDPAGVLNPGVLLSPSHEDVPRGDRLATGPPGGQKAAR